jgi:hypothetical protein
MFQRLKYFLYLFFFWTHQKQYYSMESPKSPIHLVKTQVGSARDEPEPTNIMKTKWALVSAADPTWPAGASRH